MPLRTTSFLSASLVYSPAMNIIIMNNRASFLVSFWSMLIALLKKKGHAVTCLVPAGDPEAEATLQSLGARIRNFPLDNKGLNPVHDLKTCLALYKVFREERADILYASTIKSVIYGIPMAALAGIKARYAMITGLGYMFEADSPVKKLLTCVASLLYHISLSFADAVFFQNSDDVRTFREWHCLPGDAHVVMTKGTGVDIDKFAVEPQPQGVPTFLLVGRLLEAKGLYEYAEAARLVKKAHPEVRFQLLGAPETSRGGVPMQTIKEWEREGVIEYLGVTRDVRPYVGQANVVVLPSWREGLPCSLMEAMSMGRAIVATDVPGCRDVVSEGRNGFLVPVRTPEALAKALEAFLEDDALAARMGQEGRAIAETELDARKAADLILKVMNLVS